MRRTLSTECLNIRDAVLLRVCTNAPALDWEARYVRICSPQQLACHPHRNRKMSDEACSLHLRAKHDMEARRRMPLESRSRTSRLLRPNAGTIKLRWGSLPLESVLDLREKHSRSEPWPNTRRICRHESIDDSQMDMGTTNLSHTHMFVSN
jgi:hypothetical protein